MTTPLWVVGERSEMHTVPFDLKDRESCKSRAGRMHGTRTADDTL